MNDEPLLTRRFVVVVLSGFAYFSALGALVPVVPRYIEHRLGGNDIAVGIGVGAFALGSILLRPIAGRIGDRFGRKVLMVVGAATVGVTAGCAGVIAALPWLVGTRLLMGLGEAAFFVGGTTMATDLAPVRRRGEAISYWSVAVWGGLGLGPVLGEVVLDHAHYDGVWFTSGVLAGTAAVVALATTETRTHTAVERGRLVHPAAIRPGVLLGFAQLGIVGFNTFVPLYGPEVGIDDVGLVFLLYGVIVLGVRIFGARLPDRLGPLHAGSIATAAVSTGLLMVALWHSAVGVLLGATVLAIGSAFLYPALLVLALRDVPESQRGSVVGTFSAFFDLASGTAGIVLGGLAAATDYRGAFAGGAMLALVSFTLLQRGFGQEANAPLPRVDAPLLEPPHAP